MDLGQTGIQCPTGKTSIQIEAKRSHPLQAGIPRSRSRRQRTLLQDHLPREGLLCHRQIFLGPRGGRYVYVTPWGSVERGNLTYLSDLMFSDLVHVFGILDSYILISCLGYNLSLEPVATTVFHNLIWSLPRHAKSTTAGSGRRPPSLAPGKA